MRQRTTFVNRRTLTIGRPYECIPYGPHSASAYATVKSMHAVILAERDQARHELRRPYRILRRYGMTIGEANRVLRAALPDVWASRYPYRRLSREGYELMRWAALADSIAHENEDQFACDSPLEARELSCHR